MEVILFVMHITHVLNLIEPRTKKNRKKSFANLVSDKNENALLAVKLGSLN